MSADTQQQIPALVPLPGYHKILVAADASDHSNHGVSEAVAIAGIWQGEISGAHVYAAAMHDRRFRQMEGGLPEKYRQEQELERQRDVHDELITRGLSVITDSYLDQAEQTCDKAGLRYRRRSLEGKNYTELVNEANSGQYDLLIMGAQGLGSVPGGRLGTVSARTTRRSNIDTLVIKNPECKLSSGPIVVAIDGSSRAYGGLVSALALAQNWQVPVKVIAAYDPYYHYVAFNRIAAGNPDAAGLLSAFIDEGMAEIDAAHPPPALPDGSLDWEAMTGETIDSLFFIPGVDDNDEFGL